MNFQRHTDHLHGEIVSKHRPVRDEIRKNQSKSRKTVKINEKEAAQFERYTENAPKPDQSMKIMQNSQRHT